MDNTFCLQSLVVYTLPSYSGMVRKELIDGSGKLYSWQQLRGAQYHCLNGTIEAGEAAAAAAPIPQSGKVVNVTFVGYEEVRDVLARHFVMVVQQAGKLTADIQTDYWDTADRVGVGMRLCRQLLGCGS